MKYVLNIFPKDITPWFVQDSNPGPSAPDRDSLTTRTQPTTMHNGHLFQFACFCKNEHIAQMGIKGYKSE